MLCTAVQTWVTDTQHKGGRTVLFDQVKQKCWRIRGAASCCLCWQLSEGVTSCFCASHPLYNPQDGPHLYRPRQLCSYQTSALTWDLGIADLAKPGPLDHPSGYILQLIFIFPTWQGKQQVLSDISLWVHWWKVTEQKRLHEYGACRLSHSCPTDGCILSAGGNRLTCRGNTSGPHGI